jgi:hypothetical protein
MKLFSNIAACFVGSKRPIRSFELDLEQVYTVLKVLILARHSRVRGLREFEWIGSVFAGPMTFDAGSKLRGFRNFPFPFSHPFTSLSPVIASRK